MRPRRPTGRLAAAACAAGSALALAACSGLTGSGGSPASTTAPPAAHPIDTRPPALRHLQAVMLSEMSKAGPRSGAVVTDLTAGTPLFSHAGGVARPIGAIAELDTASGHPSPGAQATPAAVVSTLGALAQTAGGRRLEASLPGVGVSGDVRGIGAGTTAAGRCRAKLGRLAGVSNLAGWCAAPGRHTLAFAFLLDGLPSAIADRRLSRMVAAVSAY